MAMTFSDVQSGTTRIAGSGTTPVELEADSEDKSRQRGKIRVSTSTKLSGTKRNSPIEYLARNLSRMTRKDEEREERLRADLEQLRSQPEQTLGTLDTRIDALLERRTHAIKDMLDGLLGNRSGSRNRVTHSRDASC